MKMLLYCDGGSRGNPGPAASGMVLTDQAGTTVHAWGEKLGETTNNVAEYTSLIRGIQKAKELGATDIEVSMDSKLVVEQVKRNWKVKEPHLQKLFIQAWNEIQPLKKFTIRHIPREKNKKADEQVNIALDS
ncbi:ribonuclease HI family protein [Candidatus Nomurabacteria bacterium]|nr:ribonuclease HI family protein [Candidatus Nomurabacteria bacterium]